MIQGILRDVSTAARRNNRRCTFTKASHVYKHPEFSLVHTNDHLLIMVKFPLVAREFFEVYRIHKTPLLMPHKITDVMFLQTTEKGIAIRNDRREYYYLSADDLTSLTTKASFSERRLVLTEPDKECIPSIFLDLPLRVKELCEYTITINVTIPTVLEVAPTLFFLHNAPSYHKECRTLNSSDNGVTVPGCRYCWATIPKYCHVSFGRYVVLSAEIESSDRSNLTLSYGINRPLISYFMKPAQVSHISGDWKTDLAPQVENIVPELSVQKKVQNFFDADAKLSLKLSSAADYLKKGKSVVQTEEVDTDDDTSNDNWFGVSWGWVEYGLGTVMLLLLGTIVLVGFLCARVNKLSAAVLFAQRIGPGRAQTLGFPTYRSPLLGTPATVAPTEEDSYWKTDNMLRKYEDIMRIADQHQVESLVVFLLLVTVAIVIIVKIRQCYMKIQHFKIRTYLAFQISNEGSELVVQVQKFQALTTDLILTTVLDPMGFQIFGYIFPVLRFEWDAVITDKDKGAVYQVQTTISLSWMEAILLRQMLHSKVTVTPILRHHGATCVIESKRLDPALLLMDTGMPNNEITSASTTSLVPPEESVSESQMEVATVSTVKLDLEGYKERRSFPVLNRPLPLIEKQRQIVAANQLK
jgi:hypothetical protein